MFVIPSVCVSAWLVVWLMGLGIGVVGSGFVLVRFSFQLHTGCKDRHHHRRHQLRHRCLHRGRVDKFRRATKPLRRTRAAFGSMELRHQKPIKHRAKLLHQKSYQLKAQVLCRGHDLASRRYVIHRSKRIECVGDRQHCQHCIAGEKPVVTV